jgi:hypothetical protein
MPGRVALQPNEVPRILESTNLDRDIKILMSQRYFVIGSSSFNGGYEGPQKAIAQAQVIGASLILMGSEYTGTQLITSPVFIPNSQTTYHSGTVYGSGGVYGSYSGTSTSHGTTVVPVTSEQQRYDQSAIFFAKTNHKFKFGVSIIDLTPELRLELERNSGALIDVVMEDSPTFYANVLPGDVLISVDGQDVHNSLHATELMGQVPASQTVSKLVVIRKGEKRKISVKF